jgi:hypothetical protein
MAGETAVDHDHALTYEEFKEHMEMHACRHCESLQPERCRGCYEHYLKSWKGRMK